MSEILDVECLNVGFRGNGNVAISNTINRFLSRRESKENLAFLIVWSDAQRPFEISEEVEDINRYDRIVGVEHHFKYESKNYGDCTNRWLTEAAYNATVNILTNYNIPFMMTNSLTNEMFSNRRLEKKVFDNGTIAVGWSKDKDYGFVFDREKIREHYIEPYLQNNTLYDIITERWKTDKDINLHYYMKKYEDIEKKIWETSSYITRDLHPNESGYRLIAETIAPYIKPILEE